MKVFQSCTWTSEVLYTLRCGRAHLCIVGVLRVIRRYLPLLSEEISFYWKSAIWLNLKLTEGNSISSFIVKAILHIDFLCFHFTIIAEMVKIYVLLQYHCGKAFLPPALAEEVMYSVLWVPPPIRLTNKNFDIFMRAGLKANSKKALGQS